VSGRRQQCLAAVAAVVSGGCSGWSQTVAVAAVGTALGGSRGANTSNFHMSNLTFYTLAYVYFPHTHTHTGAHFPLFHIYVSESASSKLVPICTDAMSAQCTGVTGPHTSCTGFQHTG